MNLFLLLLLNNLFYINIIIIINANNDHFAVLCNKYFSACDWRFIRCQFVADVKENPRGFQSQLNTDGLTLAQL